ncbi:beta-1,4 N-acetylgalactosaminyltransferase 2-like [Engraulis encrasicolus]|uniref:beta-1,4 N-acetylgalactosaminyltransferase 2-like n=1 Tax=Engraulis encrasicolus TaxID=184585 RepID=UPI002FD37038
MTPRFIKARTSSRVERQHAWDSTGLAGVFIVPPNSPLQYPSHGLTVEPLKSTLIPGLAVHARGRNTFKVTLCASHGVLEVKSVQQGQEVTGQKQMALNITATSLAQLNNLLAQLAYRSTSYLLQMEDLIHFSFEDHEVIFPVTIKRSLIPVMYDPGSDINSQVTIVTKTFIRYKELGILIKSIRAKYPDILIIIADDSFKPEKVEGHNIYQYIMPPAQGWFAGRNLAVSQVTSKYFLWVDDDFLFLKETSIEKFVEIMEAEPKLDLLGGSVSGNRFYATLDYQEGKEGGCLSRQLSKHHGQLPGFKNCVLVDAVVNFFLARTDAVRRVGFDPHLKRTAHSEFFVDGLGRLLVASCGHLVIGHQGHQPNRGQYDQFRHTPHDDMTTKSHLTYFKNYRNC